MSIIHHAPANNYSIISKLDPIAEEARKNIDEDEAFWIADFNHVRESLSLWHNNLPDVHMHYAMKCCDEPNLLHYLVNHGVGFDCASLKEIEQMLSYGAKPEDIVFSHPLKSIQAIKYAKEHNVKRLVYDSIDELQKIMKYYPEAEVFLRVKPRFSMAEIQLSKKFGAQPEDVPGLLKATKECNANFIGISFHVGSLCDDLKTFRVVFEYVYDLKKEAEDLGLKVRFIDIGGGFMPPNAPCHIGFKEIAALIEKDIHELFGNDKIEFISEPGRFIGSEYMDLYVPVIGEKLHLEEDGSTTQSIYIQDGIYGSFNALNYDHAVPHFEILSKVYPDSKKYSTSLWGQTCDSADIVYDEMQWPKLEIGDLLVIKRFSAYTYSPTSFFNGFHHHQVVPVNLEDPQN